MRDGKMKLSIFGDENFLPEGKWKGLKNFKFACRSQESKKFNFF